MSYYGSLAAPYKIFRQRVTVFREDEIDSHFVAVSLYAFHHSEVHDVLVPVAGMLHFMQNPDYFFRCHISYSV